MGQSRNREVWDMEGTAHDCGRSPDCEVGHEGGCTEAAEPPTSFPPQDIVFLWPVLPTKRNRKVFSSSGEVPAGAGAGC